MALQTLPVRGLGDIGVITDIDPSALPTNAYSRAKNVRFDEGSITRSPIFRTILGSLSLNPRLLHGVEPVSGHSTVILASDTYVINEYSSGSLTDRSGSISATSASDLPFTSTTLADIIYINREDKVPSYRANGGTNFAALTNWDSNWRSKSLRSYGDFLLGINMTESSTNYSSRVRWSDITTANAIPGSWDATDATKSAGFNDLIQIKTPLIDGAVLGTVFILYSKTDVYLMEFVGGALIFNFRKVFSDIGIINQNCVVEIDSKHYVFGNDDIYVHDGTSRESICDQRTKDYIFGGLDNSKIDRCFVHWSPDLEEVYFCYPSGDDMVAFSDSDRCNRAAVFNYKNNTWSFMDLPNVTCGTIANVNSSGTYANTSTAYNVIGGSYFSQQANFDRHTLFAGENNSSDGITSDKLYGLDSADQGSLSFAIDTEATKAPFAERTGIDMDELVPVSGYKIISKIYPQVTTPNQDKNFVFNFGAADLIANSPNYESNVTFNASSDHKMDSRAAGRYLSYKLTTSDNKDFAFTGFDLDLMTTGRR